MRVFSTGAVLALSSLASAMMPTNRPVVLSDNAEYIPDRYIVVLQDGLSSEQVDLHLNWVSAVVLPSAYSTSESSQYGIKDVFNFKHKDFKGYFGEFPLDVIQSLTRNENVKYIEPDMVVRTMRSYTFDLSHKSSQKDSSSSSEEEEEVDSPSTKMSESAIGASQLETHAPWGLARISHRHWENETDHDLYPYYETTGENVTAYIVDTGCNVDHNDFEGRASWGVSTVDEGMFDGNGHGTHVSATVAGKKYGVAKKANIVAIKVLSSEGSGSTSGVIKGIEWAAEHHTERAKKSKDGKAKSVANMSLGGGRSRALDHAVDAAVAAGIHFAVAAGNENQDACNTSPAASQHAITVGASTITDRRAWFSNWGRCVDIFAPGKDILSAWKGSKSATNVISGTSMASPHICGVLASYISRPEYEDLDPSEIKELITKKLSTKGAILGLIGRASHTKNR